MSRKEQEGPKSVVKRRNSVQGEVKAPSPQDGQDLFRKFFEQRYAPLEVHVDRAAECADIEPNAEEDEPSDAEWEGFDDAYGSHKVVLVEHRAPVRDEDKASTGEAYKTYMTSKPPKANSEDPSTRKALTRQEPTDHDISETANLKNDLALQRLLKESHLLESTKASAPTGAQRHRAIDLRLRDLGSKDSTSEQTKMPLSHRKGIKAKAAAIETRRRADAKENGIILERPSLGTKSRAARRERGVGRPAVGKFAGGTLKLNRKDLQAIQGPKSTGKRKRGR